MQDNLENIYELTPLQQGLLIETLSKPDKDAYIIQFILTLDATKLDETALYQAWQKVMQRHAVLRSAFYWQDLDKPVQVVLRAVKLPWQVLDWQQHKTVAAELEQWQLTDLQQPFAIDDAPLFRCTLIRVNTETTWFIWTVHHLINDGWSYPILLNEVLAFYQAIVTGQTISLPLPRPFVDYIDWLQQQDMAQAKTFWCNKLAGFNTTTALGASKPTPTGQTNYQTQHLLLSPKQTEDLRLFAQQYRLTLNTILQGVWAIILARYSNSDDVMFGGIVSGRPSTLVRVESMVGMFTNTLPVRVKFDANTNLLPWLQNLQQQQVEQEQYAYCSLVDIHSWSDVPRGSPLFESIFAYENYPLDARWEQLGLIFNMQAVERVPYPLSFVAMLRKVMELHVHYDATRFTNAMITRLLGHVQTLLASILAQPNILLCDLQMLSSAEMQDLLLNHKATTKPNSAYLCIHELFEAQVIRTPDAIALKFANTSLTYKQLNAQANQLAVWLRKQGVKPDMLVGICLPRSLQLVVSILGILKAGGACLPLDPNYPMERLQYMLTNAQTNLLLTTTKLQAFVTANMHIASTEIIFFTAWESLSDLPQDNLPCQTQAQHLAYCLYTSGSSGQPKGVAMPHLAMVNLTLWQQTNYRLEQAACTLQFSPISFDVSFQEIFTTLCSGGSLVLIDEKLRLDAAALLSFIETAKIERLFLPFVALQQLANVAMGNMPTSLRDVITAGEQLILTDSLKLWFKDSDCALHNHYGPTETHVITAYTLQGEVSQWPLLPPIGKPIANIDLYLLDKHGQLVPVGIPGELYVAGDCLARGYINNTELTGSFLLNKFGNGLLYRTGDLAYRREDGNLEFLGRADNQLKIRGFRIEPGEIEILLNQQPAIQDAYVCLHEVKPGDKRLVAYCVTTQVQHREQEAANVLRALREKLPDYMIPSAIIMLDAFPLTPSGKLDVQALPAPTWGSAVSAEALPSTPTEQALACIWQEVLKLESVGIFDNFFALGGHSLLATQVISRINHEFGLNVPFHYLFEYPNISNLAVQVDSLLRNQSLLADSREEMELL